MQPPVSVQDTVTYPPGAVPGQARIVIDGVRGAIFEYLNGTALGSTQADNPLAGSWASSAGTDPYGNGYPQGFRVQGVIEGTDYEINANGVFFYSSTPAAGNLLFSYAGPNGSGTDEFGNTYLQGMSFYIPLVTGAVDVLNIGPAGDGLSAAIAWLQAPNYHSVFASQYQVTFNEDIISFGQQVSFADMVSILGNQAGPLFNLQNNFSTGGGNPTAQLAAAAAGDDTLGIKVIGDTFNRWKIDSNGTMSWGPGNATQDATLGRISGGNLQTNSDFFFTSPGGTVYQAEGSADSNFNNNTVTAATPQNLTNQSVPAADATVGAIYHLRAFLKGQWGSTAWQFNFQATVGGTTFAFGSIGAAAFSASALVEGVIDAYLVCKTTGAGGTWVGMIECTLTQKANTATGLSAADNTVHAVGNDGNVPITVSTLAANTFEIDAWWNGTTGGPTMTKYFSYLEKLS